MSSTHALALATWRHCCCCCSRTPSALALHYLHMAARLPSLSPCSCCRQAAARVKSLDELAGAGREDDVDAVEAAQEKARRFDDWADGVPRGSGVTKRI